MNSLALTQRFVRVLVSLAAVTSLFFTAGCGSSAPAKSNPVGFSASSLSGTYVFSTSGVDSTNGVFQATTGVFTANGGTGGSNSISTGQIDINGFTAGEISTAITGGTYSVNTDGRGTATLNFSGTSITLDFVLTAPAGGPSAPSTHGLVTEFDTAGSGSGTLDMQNAGNLVGSYSFGLAGAYSSGNSPLAMVGAFTPNDGNITGLTDINANQIALGGTAGLTLTGTVTTGSPGTAVLNSFNGNTLIATYNFHVYEIDPTHLKFIETDTGTIMAGDAFTQQTSLPQGGYAYVLEGEDSSGPIAEGGYFTSDGTSTIIAGGLEDYNDAGNFVPENTTVGGSFTPFSGGRTQLTLTGFYNGTASTTATFAAYPSSGGVQLLEIDDEGITGGYALAQGTPTTLAATDYALNLSGINPNSEEDDIAEFALTGTNYQGVEDVNDDGSLGPRVAFNGTITPDTSITGHGAAVTNGEINFNYYVADSGATALIIDTDANPSPQVGIGSIESQNITSAEAASRSHALISRPLGKRTGAFRRKANQ